MPLNFSIIVDVFVQESVVVDLNAYANEFGMDALHVHGSKNMVAFTMNGYVFLHSLNSGNFYSFIIY